MRWIFQASKVRWIFSGVRAPEASGFRTVTVNPPRTRRWIFQVSGFRGFGVCELMLGVVEAPEGL